MDPDGRGIIGNPYGLYGASDPYGDESGIQRYEGGIAKNSREEADDRGRERKQSQDDCCNKNSVTKLMNRLKNSVLHMFGLDSKFANEELEEAQTQEEVVSAIDYLKESQENLHRTNENLKDVAEILATIEPTGISGVYYEYTLGDSNTDKALAILSIIPFTKLAKGAKVVKFIQAGKKVEALLPSGFKVVKGQYSRGQKVYSNGKLFISPDVDGHNGGMWKAAQSLKDLGRKETRLGTFDGLFQKIGD